MNVWRLLVLESSFIQIYEFVCFEPLEIDDSASWVTEDEVDIPLGSEMDDEVDEEDDDVESNLIRDDSIQVFRQHSSKRLISNA